MNNKNNYLSTDFSSMWSDELTHTETSYLDGVMRTIYPGLTTNNIVYYNSSLTFPLTWLEYMEDPVEVLKPKKNIPNFHLID